MQASHAWSRPVLGDVSLQRTFIHIESPDQSGSCVLLRFCFVLRHKGELGHHMPVTVLTVE